MSKHVYLSLAKYHANNKYRKQLAIHPLMNSLSTKSSPPNFDLKNKIISIYDQGSIGSCTSNAICQALRMTQKYHHFNPSRLYLYAKERVIEANGNTNISDSGADAIDGLNQLEKYGVCSESLYPYIESKVNDIPPPSCDIDASHHKIHSIGKLCSDDASTNDKITAIEHVISSGIPVLVGIQVYESFESDQVASNGVVPLPNISTEKLLGGHEVLIVGYDHNIKKFILVNSWGGSWGNHGYFTLDYEYITNPDLSSELICITQA